MTLPSRSWPDRLVSLAVTLLFLMVWGFTGFGKLVDGFPEWFAEVFGKTLLATVPGLRASYWMLALVESAAAVLCALSLLRLEFLGGRPARFLNAALVLGLFNFLLLGFGKWLTQDFNGAFQLFLYFSGTLVAWKTVRELEAGPVEGG
jgi:hypothetical protein